MKVSTSMEAEELQDLCKGKIQWRKCQDCDVDGFQWRKCQDSDIDGFQYRNDHANERVCNNPSHVAPDRIEKVRCETCGGIGYQFYRVDGR